MNESGGEEERERIFQADTQVSMEPAWSQDPLDHDLSENEVSALQLTEPPQCPESLLNFDRTLFCEKILNVMYILKSQIESNPFSNHFYTQQLTTYVLGNPLYHMIFIITIKMYLCVHFHIHKT